MSVFLTGKVPLVQNIVDKAKSPDNGAFTPIFEAKSFIVAVKSPNIAVKSSIVGVRSLNFEAKSPDDGVKSSNVEAKSLIIGAKRPKKKKDER